MVQGLEVFVDVSWVKVEARIGGQVVCVSKELEVGREVRAMSDVNGVLMGRRGEGGVCEVEGEGVTMIVVKGMEIPAEGGVIWAGDVDGEAGRGVIRRWEDDGDGVVGVRRRGIRVYIVLRREEKVEGGGWRGVDAVAVGV